MIVLQTLETVGVRLLSAPLQKTNFTRASSALVHEYLRRLAVWSRLFNSSVWPWNDLRRLAEELELPDNGEVESLTQEITLSHDLNHVEHKVVRNLLYFYLYSDAFIDLAQNTDLLDPYEPMVLLFERGGTFISHHAEVLITQMSFPIRRPEYWSTQSPIESLSTEYLDQLDQRY